MRFEAGAVLPYLFCVMLAVAPWSARADPINEAFRAAQWASLSSAGKALHQLGLREATGDPELAAIVRSRQDLLSAVAIREAELSTVRDANTAVRLRGEIDSLNGEIAAIDTKLAAEFPRYAELANPAPVDIASVQAQLREDEGFCRKLFGNDGQGMKAPRFREVVMFKGRHFDQSVILLCVRWYLAYNLSLRDLEEMMAERGLSVDHSTVHRWVVRFSPQLLERFNRRKRTVTGKWHLDETYIKVRGQWMYLYRAIDSVGDTVEFFFSEHRDLVAAKRFLRKAFERHGRPERIVIDASQTNREAIIACDGESRLRDRSRRLKLIRIRRSRYLNNRLEQDHRRIKRRIRSMLGFKSQASAAVILSGIEMIHMMRKRQARYAYNPRPSIAEQFEILAA